MTNKELINNILLRLRSAFYNLRSCACMKNEITVKEDSEGVEYLYFKCETCGITIVDDYFKYYFSPIAFYYRKDDYDKKIISISVNSGEIYSSFVRPHSSDSDITDETFNFIKYALNFTKIEELTTRLEKTEKLKSFI